MPRLNYYLKTPEKSSGKSLIQLRFRYNGRRLNFTFGQSIDPTNWNSSKQRVKGNLATIDGQYKLNDLLDELSKECNKAYHELIKSGIPQEEVIKQRLVGFLNQQDKDSNTETLYKLIDRFIANEIKSNGRDKSYNTIKTYKTILGHLREFELKTKYKLDFDTITLDFYYKYIAFLKTKKLSINSRAKDIQIIKVFMREAFDMGYTTNMHFKSPKFSVIREDTDAVYLKRDEIMKLYRCDLSHDIKLETARDLFVFGCSTGLRFSDYSNVKPENIVPIVTDEGKVIQVIKMLTQKTGEEVSIPCDRIVEQILKKYNNNMKHLPGLPTSYKDYTGKFNPLIKEACKVAGLKEKGRLIDDLNLELWQCITSHTARRSYATNYFIAKVNTTLLMKITGHRTEKAFLKYIRVSKLDIAQTVAKHMEEDWRKQLLAAV